MRLRVIATDYDGTIVRNGVLDASVREAIANARKRGVLVVIVTGRILSELRQVAGCLEFVDGVVAENGAVVALWAGWPFFVRGFRSLVTWNLNMFTLIAIGVGAAWLYSLFVVMFPGLLPDDLKVDGQAEVFHAKDCEDCETQHGRLDRIDKTIELLGEMDDAQRTRLMEIADRCPVYRTLQSEVIIHSKQG